MRAVPSALRRIRAAGLSGGILSGVEDCEAAVANFGGKRHPQDVVRGPVDQRPLSKDFGTVILKERSSASVK